MRIDKVSPLLYNESNGGGEMFPGLEKQMMHLRIESKAEENRKKPPLVRLIALATVALCCLQNEKQIEKNNML